LAEEEAPIEDDICWEHNGVQAEPPHGLSRQRRTARSARKSLVEYSMNMHLLVVGEMLSWFSIQGMGEILT
jgi:hypothetical protein